MINRKSVQAPITIKEVVEKYQDAQIKLTAAYKNMEELNIEFGSLFEYEPFHSLSGEYKERERNLRSKAWEKIIAISGARKYLSNKRTDELDERLYSYGRNNTFRKIEPMPEITVDEVHSMIDGLRQNGRDMAQEMIIEAFDYLRRGSDEFKRNKKFRVNKKVIVYGVERKFSGGFGIGSYQHGKFRSIDRAFYLLDGKSMDAEYERSSSSPLSDAIYSSDNGKGETVYFKFQCYGKGTCHLTMKRPDLVDILNQVGNGGRFELGM